MKELEWVVNLLSCLGVDRNEANIRAMTTLWLTDAAGPGAAEGFLAEVRPGAFPIPRHYARLESIVQGVDRLLEDD